MLEINKLHLHQGEALYIDKCEQVAYSKVLKDAGYDFFINDDVVALCISGEQGQETRVCGVNTHKVGKYDPVNKPEHYCEGRKYEPKDVIRDWELNFNLGSAVKYLSRAGRKISKVEDLEKAMQFIQFEIDAIKEERASEPAPQENWYTGL